MRIDLAGRTALITGGSTGLGKATALRLAASGAAVVILARRKEVLEAAAAEIAESSGGVVMPIPCDVTDDAACDRAVAAAMDRFGTVDILVNNAGFSFRRTIEDMTTGDMLADLDLKLFAAVRLSQRLLPGMKEQRWGRIINILALAAKAPGAGGAPTALSRAAGMALTKIMSRELAPFNILVNALCIGKIKSGQWERRYEAMKNEVSYDDFLARAATGIPLERLGESEELANVACFLASPAASYVTGTAINVDGGLCAVT